MAFEVETNYNPQVVETLVAEWRAHRKNSTLRAIIDQFGAAILRWSRYYKKDWVEYDDLHQVARIAIYEALERFDESRGNRLASLVNDWIRGRLANFVRDQNGPIKVPANKYEKGVLPPPVLSVDAPLPLNRTGYEEDLFLDVPVYYDFETMIDVTRLHDAIAALSPLHQGAIKASYFQDPCGPVEFAKLSGVTKQAVQTTRRRAERQLRVVLA